MLNKEAKLAKHLHKFVEQDQKAYQEDNSETFFLYT